MISQKFDEWKLWSLLRDYPEYMPPCRGVQKDPSQSERNYRYFLEEKDGMLNTLCQFLACYDVNGKVEAGEFDAIGAWLHRYGGHLVASRFSLRSLMELDLPWNGRFSGLNVIYDIGILIGEHLISRGFGARWGLPGRDEDSGYMHPFVFGLRRTYFGKDTSLFPPQHVFECCDSSKWRLRGRVTRAHSSEQVNELARRVEYWSREDEERE